MADKLRLRTDDDLNRRSADTAAVRDALIGEGIDYWLANGALLGAIREGDFIRWDWDVEIDVFSEDLTPAIGVLTDRLVADGFKVAHRTVEGLQLACRRPWEGGGGQRVSVMGWDDHGEFRVKHGWKVPASMWATGFNVTIRGETYQAHAPAEDYLKWTYGPDWRTPKRDGWHRRYLTPQFRGAAR